MLTKKSKRGFLTFGIFLFVSFIVVLFFYFDRYNEISTYLRSLGTIGITIAILLMAIVCTTPTPSEGLLLMYMKIFGVWIGAFYGWLGAIISTLFVYFLAHFFGKRIVQSIINEVRLTRIDDWVKKNGTMGLLFVRFLPLPAFILSYAVGTIPSVKLWPYVWTGSVTILPYYIGAALIYHGVSKHLITWIGIGFAILLLFVFAGYYVKQKWYSNDHR